MSYELTKTRCINISMILGIGRGKAVDLFIG